MRIGQNPAKFVNNVAKPARVTVAILNYIRLSAAIMPNYPKSCMPVLTALLKVPQTSNMI
jgi:hypothetical protein